MVLFCKCKVNIFSAYYKIYTGIRLQIYNWATQSICVAQLLLSLSSASLSVRRVGSLYGCLIVHDGFSLRSTY